MEHTITEYDFIPLRKSFEDWLLERIPVETGNKFLPCILFDFSTQAAALFVKYICDNSELLPPDTPKRLFELESERLASIPSAFFATSLAQASLSEDAISPETLEEFRAASSGLFSEDVSAWLELASEAGNASSFVNDAEKRIQQRADESLSIPSNWWKDHPYQAEHWQSIFGEIYSLLKQTGEKSLSYSDPLVRHNARLGFSSLLEFTADLYRQRAEEIPNSDERELTDKVVETTLAFFADSFFLNYLPQDFYQDLGKVSAEDLLRLCGFAYLGTLVFLSIPGPKTQQIPSFDNATWLFGLSDHDCKFYSEVAPMLAVAPSSSDTDYTFLSRPQHECDLIFAVDKHYHPVLSTLWVRLQVPLSARLDLFDAEQEQRNLGIQTHAGIREPGDYPSDSFLQGISANEAIDAERSPGRQHFIEIRDAACKDVLSRAERLLNTRDYELLRNIVTATTDFLTVTICDTPLPLEFYDHLSNCTQSEVTEVLGLTYLHTILLFAQSDRRNPVTTRLLKHATSVFHIRPYIVGITRDTAKGVHRPNRETSRYIPLYSTFEYFFRLTRRDHLDFVYENFLSLLSTLAQIIDRDKQRQHALETEQAKKPGCLFRIFLALFMIVLFGIVLALFVEFCRTGP